MAVLPAGAVPYRLPQPEDAVWPPPMRAYGGPDVGRWKTARLVAVATLQLTLPVILTPVLLGASYLYADAVLPLLRAPKTVRGALLATSDLVLPIGWFSIHLTNRRYGPAHAFAQLLASLVLGLAVILINPYDLNDWVATLPALTVRAVISFGAAFLVSNFVGIAFFDGARVGGPRLWRDPSPRRWCSAPFIIRRPLPASINAGRIWWRCISWCFWECRCCCWDPISCSGPRCVRCRG